MDARASASVAGYGVHSSNTMTTSEPRFRCTAMDRSGVSSTRSPLTGERKMTPASEILRSSPRLHTWNPPESVRIGLSQCMNRCRPPSARTVSSPGRSMRWKVLPSRICVPASTRSAGVIALTVP
jgi:hypothetical protein